MVFFALDSAAVFNEFELHDTNSTNSGSENHDSFMQLIVFNLRNESIIALGAVN